MPPADTWDISRLYSSIDAWEADFKLASPPWDDITALRGKLGDSPDNVLRAVERSLAVARVIERLFTFAHLRMDQDVRDDASKRLSARASDLMTQFAEATSFIEPEIVALPAGALSLASAPQLAPYRFYLDKILRQRAHTLSADGEALLALSSKATSAPARAFSALNDADFEFGTVRDSGGAERTVSHGQYGSLIRSEDRVLRREAFERLHAQYRAYENTLAELLAGALQNHVFRARARRYDSALAAALAPDAIPTSVYANLVDTVRASLRHHHRYVSLRRRLLHLDELHLYDMYVPIVRAAWSSSSSGDDGDGAGAMRMSFDEAVDAVVASVAPLGDEYQRAVADGLRARRWVDRYENRGKRSGAYSSGCYDSEPYILMNFDGQLNDVFTLAHEVGHSMHSYFSRRHQPYVYADYSIFVAEVASTFNEQLLSKYLYEQRARTDAQRAFLVNRELEDLRGTLFRQTMFAAFDLEAHSMAERGEPLTPAALRAVYRRLNEEWFGGRDAVVVDELIEWELFRIPHFYYNYYVYQYATGVSAAVALSERVLGGGEREREAYLNYLRAGSSADPIDVLRGAGVDMTSAAPVQATLDKFARLVDQLDQLTRGKQR